MGDGTETLRERGQPVAVAVPDVEVLAEAVEERSDLVDVQQARRRIRAGR